RVRRVVEPVDELEAERHQQGHSEQHKRENRRRMHDRQIGDQVRGCVDEADGKRYQENCDSNLTGRFGEFLVNRVGNRSCCWCRRKRCRGCRHAFSFSCYFFGWTTPKFEIASTKGTTSTATQH